MGEVFNFSSRKRLADGWLLSRVGGDFLEDVEPDDSPEPYGDLSPEEFAAKRELVIMQCHPGIDESTRRQLALSDRRQALDEMVAKTQAQAQADAQTQATVYELRPRG